MATDQLPQPHVKTKQSPPVALAERKNRAEAEALRYRIGFLEWRQRHLMTKYDFRAEDIKKNAKVLSFTSGKSQHSELCRKRPVDYPKLHLRTEYLVSAGGDGFHTPEPIKEKSSQNTLKWDQGSFRSLIVPSADEELFSLANMHRWRGKGQDFGRHAKYLNLPSLDPAAAIKSYKRSRALTRFLTMRAQNCSGRLRQLHEHRLREEAEDLARLAGRSAAGDASQGSLKLATSSEEGPVNKLMIKLTL